MPDVVDGDWVRSAAPHSIDNFFSRLTPRLNQSIQKLIIPSAAFITTGIDSLLGQAGRHRGPCQHCGYERYSQ